MDSVMLETLIGSTPSFPMRLGRTQLAGSWRIRPAKIKLVRRFTVLKKVYARA